MATPQTPQGFIAWMKWVEGRIAFILERLNNVLANTGLSIPSPGVTQVDGNLNVVGSSTVSGTNGIKSSNYVPGTTGWNFTGTSLEANTGVIGNGALANPVTPGVVLQTASNYAVSGGSLTTIVSQSVTVPANCTQLLAHALVFSFVVNPNTTGGSNGAGGDIHELKAYIGGSGGQTTGVSISGSNGQTSVSAGAAVLLTGLTPGGTVLLEARAGNGFQAFAANGSNVASITATLLWLR